jgi:hypothetical protein
MVTDLCLYCSLEGSYYPGLDLVDGNPSTVFAVSAKNGVPQGCPTARRRSLSFLPLLESRGLSKGFVMIHYFRKSNYAISAFVSILQEKIPTVRVTHRLEVDE